MLDFPRSLVEFQSRFADEAACVAYLFAARWPHGFVCPACGTNKAWRLQTKAWTGECAGCGRQTSVTAGTIMHHSKLPLTTWFWAAYLMATHSNGISALQLQRQLALGWDNSAWLMATKLRRSMVAPDRSPLAGLVEVDETEIVCRSKNNPVIGGGGRSHQGKILVVGAVEDGGAGPGRIRLACMPSSKPILLPAPPPRPMDGRGIPAPPASITIRMSSTTWPPISSYPGRTASSPISKSGPWASITACAAATCRPISTSSSSASTTAVPGMPPSAPCSASPQPTRPSLTRC
jgi:Transposase zinc-ribbon domain